MNSLDLSWRVLINQGISQLPVSLEKICDTMGITVRSYLQAVEVIHVLGMERVCRVSDGLSFAWNRELYILYNSDRPSRRIRFTIAHELGHCLLHHGKAVCSKPLLRVNVCQDARALERQANTFAADLLSPACVLWGLGITTAGEIASHCDISMEAGKIRLDRLQKLIKRDAMLRQTRGQGCLLRSPLEQRVYTQFLPYIEAMRVNR